VGSRRKRGAVGKARENERINLGLKKYYKVGAAGKGKREADVKREISSKEKGKLR